LHPHLGFVFRKSDEKISSGMVLLDVAKVFDSKWIERLLDKLTNLDFHMLKTISLFPFADIPKVLPLSHIGLQ